MPLPHLVGFCGRISSGKTTAARVLVRHYGFARLSFADTLRAMLLALGLTIEDLTDTTRKEQPHPLLCGRTPRHAMQTLGTNWARQQIGDEVWINAARARLSRALAGGESVVFDDLRFDNEARLIRSLGGLVIRIDNLRQPPPPVPAFAHASELGVSPDLIHEVIAAVDAPALETHVLSRFNQLAA